MGKIKLRLKKKPRHKIFILSALGRKILWVFGLLLLIGFLSLKFTFFRENQSLFVNLSSSIISSFIGAAGFKFLLQKITFGKLDKYFIEYKSPNFYFSLPLFFLISFILFWVFFIFVGSWFVFGF